MVSPEVRLVLESMLSPDSPYTDPNNFSVSLLPVAGQTMLLYLSLGLTINCAWVPACTLASLSGNQLPTEFAIEIGPEQHQVQ